MRILYVTCYYKPAYVYGGPVLSCSTLCEGLVHAGAQVVVYTTNANGAAKLDVPLEQPVDVDGVKVWYYPLFLNGLFYFFSPALSKAVKACVAGYDLVVIESLWMHPLILTANACIRSHVPYVVPTRGQLFPWALDQGRLKKNLYLKIIGLRYMNFAAAIHCTDPVEAEAVIGFGLHPPVFVIPNCLNSSNYKNIQITGNLRRSLGISEQASVLLFLGRLTRIKRPDIAVDALAAAQSLEQEVHLIFVGPDEDGLIPVLRAKAQSLACDHRLHFTGLLKKEAVASALKETDLLLMPTETQENFGMAALEAMAAGVPVLVSEGVPVGRWAQKAGAGQVVPCSNISFQQATLELLSNPEQLRAMGKRGQILVKENFDSSVVARRTLAQYQAIATTGKPLQETEFSKMSKINDSA